MFTSKDDLDPESWEILGEGGFSTAWRVQRKDDSPPRTYYVLKKVNLTRVLQLNNDAKQAEKIVENCRQEFSNMQVCSHPHVVRVFGSFEDSEPTISFGVEQRLYYLVMEYCEGGDLAQLIKRRSSLASEDDRFFDEEQIRTWSLQLTSAVKFLHDRSIVHRDIKPSNIYLTKDYKTVKLGDFGLAKDVDLVSQSTITLVGTPGYYAPEFCTCAQPWTKKCDVWALGVVIYELANLEQPYSGDGFAVVMAIWKKEPKPFSDLSGNRYSEQLRDFVMAMLEKKPEARPDIDQVSSHAFLHNKEKSNNKSSSSTPRRQSASSISNNNVDDVENINGSSSLAADNNNIKNGEKYQKGTKLQSNELVTTWLVKESRSGNKCVLKAISLDKLLDDDENEGPEAMSEIIDDLVNECELMKTNVHDHIIRVLDYFEESSPLYSQRYFSIVIEYLPGGDLRSLIKKHRLQDDGYFTEPQIKSWSLQLVSAIEYLHDVEFLHQSINPTNIFLSSNNEIVKLGLSSLPHLNSNDHSDEGYLAPEIGGANSEQAVYTAKCDVWSLGATVFEMAFLEPPGNSGSCASGAFEYSEMFGDFLKRMLRQNPETRPNIWQVAKHAFLLTAAFTNGGQSNKTNNKQRVSSSADEGNNSDRRGSSSSHNNQQNGKAGGGEKETSSGHNNHLEGESSEGDDTDAATRASTSSSKNSSNKSNKPVVTPRRLSNNNNRATLRTVAVPRDLNPENLLLAAQVGEVELLRQWLRSNEGKQLLLTEDKKIVNWNAIPDQFWDAAPLKQRVPSGDRPIHRAVRFMQREVVRLLVDEFAAPLNVRNNRGALPIHIAAAKGDAAIVEHLISKQPESLEAKVSPGPGFLRSFAKKMESLLKTRSSGSTAVHLAAEAGHVDVLRALLRRKPQLVDSKDEYGNTPLCRATASFETTEDQMLDVVKCLVDRHGANVNVPGYLGTTPLMFASERGRIAIVEFLVEKGADLMAFSCSGNGETSTAIHVAAQFNRLAIVEFFSRNWPQLVEVRDKSNNTPLNRAACGGALEVVEHLINKTTSKIENRGRKGRTALLEAAAKGHLAIVKFLADHGANMYAIDDRNRNTALHLAAYYGRLDVCDYLRHLQLSRGIDLDAVKNANGDTPEKFASYGVSNALLQAASSSIKSSSTSQKSFNISFHVLI